jgi:hypothetical protein
MDMKKLAVVAQRNPRKLQSCSLLREWTEQFRYSLNQLHLK